MPHHAPEDLRLPLVDPPDALDDRFCPILLAAHIHPIGGGAATAEHHHLPGEMGNCQIGHHGVRPPAKICTLIFCERPA